MRAVTFAKPGAVEVTDKPVPELAPDEVLVKIGGAGLCHSDLHILHMPADSPLIGRTLGHESAGWVERLGEQVTGFAVGDAVLVSLIWGCGQCAQCLAGRDNLCEATGDRTRMPKSPGIGPEGGMAEFIAVKARLLDPIGSLNPVDAAPLADAALTPMHAINSVRHRLTSDATVVTIGLGGLGHLGLQILAATTGARIIALDTDEAKLAAAPGHGADIALKSDGEAAAKILELTGGLGADVVLDFVGVQPTVDLATAVIASGGSLRFVGLGGGSFPYVAGTGSLPWGVNVERSFGGTRSEQREVIALAQAGKIAADIVRYPLEDAPRAFADLEAGRVPGRAVLIP